METEAKGGNKGMEGEKWKMICPKCKRDRIVRAGSTWVENPKPEATLLESGKVQRYKCQDCQYFMIYPEKQKVVPPEEQGSFIPVDIQPQVIKVVQELTGLIGTPGTVEIIQREVEKVKAGRAGE